MKNKILITLATGKTGYAATVQLLKENYSVRIYVRSKNTRALELEKLGAEIAIGEFNNEMQLYNALEGVTRVYYNYPIMKGMPAGVELFIKAAKMKGVEAVVFMGQRIAEFSDTGSIMTNDTRKSYDLFKASGLNVIYFVPGYFAENVFSATEFILQLGIMANPFGNGKNPWISNGDMGRVVAALLKNPEPHFGEKVFATGPKSISPKEIAEVFKKVTGKKIRLVNIPEWLFLKAGMFLGKELGYDKFTIIQAAIYNQEMQMDRFNIPPTEVVKRLTGQEPEDFETIARQYFDNSPYNKRSFSTWLSSMVRFMVMLLTTIPSKMERALINS